MFVQKPPVVFRVSSFKVGFDFMVLSFLNDLSSIVVRVSNKRHVKNPEAVVWLYSKMNPSFDVSLIASSLDES